jgi:hypothetical protein
MPGSAGHLCAGGRRDQDRMGVSHSNAIWVMRRKPLLVQVRRFQCGEEQSRVRGHDQGSRYVLAPTARLCLLSRQDCSRRTERRLWNRHRFFEDSAPAGRRTQKTIALAAVVICEAADPKRMRTLPLSLLSPEKTASGASPTEREAFVKRPVSTSRTRPHCYTEVSPHSI